MAPLRPPKTGFTVLEILVGISIVAVILGLLLVAIHNTQQSAASLERLSWLRGRRMGETGRRKLPIRILFIGNSYTNSHDLPDIITALATAANAKPALEVEKLVVGGARLKTHWDQGEAVRRIQEGTWDFVVLQEQSQTPLERFGRDQFFYPYARKFHEVIRQTDAITLFFMTWARPDTPAPQAEWTESYLRITKELRAEVVPVGVAWEHVKKSQRGLELFADAGGHPTRAGTYIAACAFYAAIYDRSPEGLPASVTTPGGTTVSVPPATAAEIQKQAWSALKFAKHRLTQNR